MSETPFRVLSAERSQSPNFFTQDPVLHAVLGRLLPEATRAWIWPQLEKMGAVVPAYVEERSAVCDKQTPVLKPFDRYGQRIDEVVYPPAYREMERVSYGSGMIGMKYDPELRALHGGALQVAGFALSYLFAQAECGQSCPICMTDGVARVLELFGTKDQQRRHVPHLASRELEKLARGAMFLTEKQGGSDVGQNATRAVKQADGSWRLYGEKWFCSNVDGELALVLARPDDAPAGTRGLGLFLLPHWLPDGSLNGVRIDRLKDKLGVRSMPSGEVVLDGAKAELVGKLDAGFKQMAEMLNLSRLWNALCSVSGMRRAIHESTEYLRARKTFGKAAIEHPLVRETLADMNAEEIAAKVLTFTLVKLVAESDGGDPTAKQLVRVVTPLAKYFTAKAVVWAASEGIELLGGNGYIEDSPMPRLLRDAQVLPVWEGTTNILILDTLRAISKTGAHLVLFEDVRARLARAPESLAREAKGIAELARLAEQDLAVIATEGPDAASGILRRFTDRLYLSYNLALLLDGAAENSPAGQSMAAALRRMLRRHLDPDARTSSQDIAALVDATVTPA